MTTNWSLKYYPLLKYYTIWSNWCSLTEWFLARGPSWFQCILYDPWLEGFQCRCNGPSSLPSIPNSIETLSIDANNPPWAQFIKDERVFQEEALNGRPLCAKQHVGASFLHNISHNHRWIGNSDMVIGFYMYGGAWLEVFIAILPYSRPPHSILPWLIRGGQFFI